MPNSAPYKLIYIIDKKHLSFISKNMKLLKTQFYSFFFTGLRP